MFFPNLVNKKSYLTRNYKYNGSTYIRNTHTQSPVGNIITSGKYQAFTDFKELIITNWKFFRKVTKYCSSIHTYIRVLLMEETWAIFISAWVNINVNAYGHSCYQFIKSELERFYDCDYVTITENVLLPALWHELQTFCVCVCILLTLIFEYL